MSWTTPPTAVSGAVATAADANIVRDDLLYLKGIADGTTFMGVDLSRSGTQSIPNSTNTNITWQVENFDYGSWWSSGVTITVPAAAVPSGYTTIALLVLATIRFVPDGASGRQLAVLVNGSTAAQANVRISESDYATVSLTSIIVVAAADAITVQAEQNSGGALNIDSARIQIIRWQPVA